MKFIRYNNALVSASEPGFLNFSEDLTVYKAHFPSFNQKFLLIIKNVIQISILELITSAIKY